MDLIPILLIDSQISGGSTSSPRTGKNVPHSPFALSLSKGANATFSNRIGITSLESSSRISNSEGMEEKEMNWYEFEEQAPELAAFGRERLERTGLVMVGTLRKDGWPRISAVEPLISEGQLYLGMMWHSRKALDLLRDPRCTLHNTITDREAADGEFKIWGEAKDIQDGEERRRYGEALYQKIGMNPEGEDYHLFTVDIQTASSAIIREEEWVRQIWRTG